MKIDIIPSGENKLDKVVFDILDKYDLPKIISEKTGLNWKRNEVKIKYFKGNADYKGLDTVLVDYNRGIYVISGIAHELVHLILHQNSWDKNPIISSFIKNNPKIAIDGTQRGGGYLIEQMVAYLIQSEVGAGIEEIGEPWPQERFEKIIKTEYNSSEKEKLARLIIDNWENRGKNIIHWLETILK